MSLCEGREVVFDILTISNNIFFYSFIKNGAQPYLWLDMLV